MAKCSVFSALLYGVEAWTINQVITDRKHAFEMWIYGRNEEALKKG